MLIADDHRLVAEACGELLKREVNVVGVVQDGRTLLQVAAQIRPELVLLDVSMPELNGLDATAQLKQTHHSMKVVVLTVTTRADVAAEAFRRGASGYVVKHCSGEELILAVRRVLRGETFLSPQINSREVDFLLRSPRYYHPRKHLTPREQEVLRLLVEGKSATEVGDLLKITPHTVTFHKYNMMDALGVRTTAELIQHAIFAGLCDVTNKRSVRTN